MVSVEVSMRDFLMTVTDIPFLVPHSVPPNAQEMAGFSIFGNWSTSRPLMGRSLAGTYRIMQVTAYYEAPVRIGGPAEPAPKSGWQNHMTGEFFDPTFADGTKPFMTLDGFDSDVGAADHTSVSGQGSLWTAEDSTPDVLFWHTGG